MNADSSRDTAPASRDVPFRARLLQGVLGGAALRALSISLGIIVAIALARTLGPHGYGIYALALSIVTLLAIPLQMGLPPLLVREVAQYQQAQRWGLLRGLLAWTFRFAMFVSIVVGVAAASVAWIVRGSQEELELVTFLWAILLVSLLGMIGIQAAALIGLRRVVVGHIPDICARAGFLMLLVLAVQLAAGLTPQSAMALNTIAAVVALGIGGLLLRRALPSAMQQAAPEYGTGAWLRSLLPLCLTGGMHTILTQIDAVMLGLFGNAEDVGIYRAATQTALLASLPLIFMGTALAADIARLHAAGDSVGLQRLMAWTGRLVLGVTAAVVLILVLVGDAILVTVFGEQFRPGHLVLALLSVGHLVGAALGPVALLLNMTGHERDTAYGSAIAAVVSIALNPMLIPFLGMVGAAVATTSAVVVWNIVLSRMVWRRLALRAIDLRRAPA
jgi:O-antigen/teichoic acid export membrane protein